MNLVGLHHLARCWRIGEKNFAERTIVAVNIIPPYHVYIDDSTQDRYGKKVVAIGAYVATVEAWARFERDWSGVLRRGPFPYFHTTDFFARQPPFQNNWTNEKRNEFMERITITASEYPILGVEAAILCEEYEQIFPREIKDGWRDPRLFALHSLLVWLHGMIAHKDSRLSVPKPLHFLIERQKGFVDKAIKLFLAIKAKFDTTGVLGEIGCGDRLTYPPLQAADLLVYEATRNLIEGEHNPAAETRKPFEKLKRQHNIMPLELRGEILRQYVKFLREEREDNPL